MSGTTHPRWAQQGYSDIISVARRSGGIQVGFANGDVVTVSAGLLGVAGDDFQVQHDSEDATRVRVVSVDGPRDIDWTTIRVASDPEFAAEMRERDMEESHRIGRRLKALRENRGFSQRDLALLVGMPAPQLSKLEAGDSDMRLSTVRSLLRAMGASFADIAGPDAPEVSVKELRKRAEKAGVPRALVTVIAEAVGARDLPRILQRGFGWSEAELVAGVPSLPRLTVPVALKAKAAQDARTSALLALARTVSEISAAVLQTSPRPVPSDPASVRAEILKQSGKMSLDTLLRWAWESGILVVPMLGAGGFSAAAWLVDTRPAIVLKEARDLASYWIFDLAHELGHLAHGHTVDRAVVDVDSPTAGDASDAQEQQANRYALDLLLPGHEDLLSAIRQRAAGPRAHLNFKPAVEALAAQAGVSPAVLGIVAAFDMPDVAQPKDRWGSANNLGAVEGPGRAIAEGHFAEAVSLESLPALDAALVRAVTQGS